MNKETIVMLLSKDIEELNMLTAGFESMYEFPESILQLAIKKANEISENLNKLNEYSSSPNTTDKKFVEEEIAQIVSNIEFTIDNTQFEEFQEEIEVDEISEVEPSFNLKKTISVENNPSKSNQDTALVDSDEDSKEEEVDEEVETSTEKHFESLNDKLLASTTLSIGDNLEQKKIKDIKQAMSLADRFRFQRELFQSNGELMNKTLSRINKMGNLEEATTYLLSNNDWDIKNPTVEEFLDLLKKRF